MKKSRKPKRQSEPQPATLAAHFQEARQHLDAVVFHLGYGQPSIAAAAQAREAAQLAKGVLSACLSTLQKISRENDPVPPADFGQSTSAGATANCDIGLVDKPRKVPSAIVI